MRTKLLALHLPVACCLVAVLAAATQTQQRQMSDPWKIESLWSTALPAAGLASFPVFELTGAGTYVATTQNNTVYGVSTTTHAIVWSHEFNASDIWFLTSVPAVDAIVVATGTGVGALKASTGALLWFNSTMQMRPDPTAGFTALTFGSTVVFRQVAFSIWGVKVYVCGIDAATGALRWCDNGATPSREFPTVACPTSAINSSFVMPYYVDSNTGTTNYFGVFDGPSGTSLWNSSSIVSFVASGEKWVAVINGTADGSLAIIVIDVSTGAQMASYALPDGVTVDSGVFVSINVLAFGNSQGSWVGGLEATSGALLWNVTGLTGQEGSTLVLQQYGNGELVAANVGTSAINFTRIDAVSGQVRWSLTDTELSSSQRLTWFGTEAVYTRDQTLSSWAVWDSQTGAKISSGAEEWALPQSVIASPTAVRTYFATSPFGAVLAFRLVA
jgi:hypothetical protein